MATLILTLATPDGTGAPRMAGYFAAALQEAGHQVVLACGCLSGEECSGQRASEEMMADLRQRNVEVCYLPGLERRYDRGGWRRLRDLARSRQAAAIIAFQPRDQLTALNVCGNLGIRCIIPAGISHHFWGPLPLRWLKSKIYARAMRRNAHLVIATSEVVRKEVVSFGVPFERTRVLPNGVNVLGYPRIQPGPVTVDVRNKIGIAANDFLFLNVGRIDAQKGQVDLVEAFAEIKLNGVVPKLVLVGGVSTTQKKRMAAYQEKIKRIVRDRGLESRVVFAGWRDDIPALLAAADAYVHSAHWEGPPLPLSVLEAMAAQRPTIFTDCSGWPDGFKDGEHGYIVPTGNVARLRDAMCQVLTTSPQARQTMATSGREFVARDYDITVVGRRFTDLVNEVL